MRRPWRHRVWFWRPSWYWYGWKTLIPFFTGGDEFDWHTICLGWTITGRVIIATRPCPGTGECAEYAADGLASWPIDAYGLDWSNGKPTEEDYEALEAERAPHVMSSHGRIAMHSEACWCRRERGPYDRRWVSEHHAECAECGVAR